jgi:hypothetical protein
MPVIAMRYCKGWARDWRSKAYRQVRREPLFIVIQCFTEIGRS